MSTAAGTCSDGHTNQFQRQGGGVFTEEDEVKLLKCYLKIARSAKKNNNNNSHSKPTLDSPALDLIEKALGPKFGQIHIADKLHRLKLQYHKFARTKSTVKTPHHRRILDIGRTIWGKGKQPKSPTPTPTTSRTPSKESGARRADLNNFPLLVSEFSRLLPGNVVWREGMSGLEERILKGMNEEWVLLHIQEAELKATRAALLHQQLRITH